MKVKDLVEKLKQFPDEMDIVVCDEVEGNDFYLSSLSEIELNKESFLYKNKLNNLSNKVVYLRWNGN